MRLRAPLLTEEAFMIKNFSRDEIIQMVKSYPEQSKFDWKRDLNISSPHKKSEIVKDVIAIANAHGTSDGYILYGVDPKENDPIIGITISSDDASIQQIVSSKIDRYIDFQYFEPEIDGKKIGIIKIIKNQKRPFIVKVDFGVLKKDTILIRRGSSTDFANYDDLQKMYLDPKNIEYVHTRAVALLEMIHKDTSISFVINEYLEIMKMIEDIGEIEWSNLELKGIPITMDRQEQSKNFSYRILKGYLSFAEIDLGFYNFDQMRIENSKIFKKLKVFISEPILVLEQYLTNKNKNNYLKMTIPKEQLIGYQDMGIDTFFFYFSSNEIMHALISIKQRILNRLICLSKS